MSTLHTSFDPTFSPSFYSFDKSDPYDFDDDQIKGEEDQTYQGDWNSNDAIPDEEFEKAVRYAKVSPSVVKKGTPDDVENVTIQIFAHLYGLANRAESKEMEDWSAILTGHSPSPKKHSYFKSSGYLQSESNFSDDSYLDYPIQAEYGIQSLLNTISEIFLGMRFDNEEEQKNPIELEDALKKDQVTWKSLRMNYSDYFRLKMDQVFQNARELLKERLKDEESAFYYRLAFYAGVITSTVGLLISRKLLIINGLALSLIMSSYMIVCYATSSLRRTQQESNLKLSIDHIYYDAAQHRLNLSTTFF